MANVENLRPIKTLSREEAKKRGSKGGKASVKAKRQRKQLKELFKSMLATSIPQEDLKEKIKTMGFKDEEENYNTLLGMTTLNEALKGNIKAVEMIRDTIGEKPKEEVAIEVNNNASKEIEDYINGRRQK
nr:MAG TPA: hypothetical protein [Caudoviricetes sp.]